MVKPIKIINIVGTRPNFMKIAPIMQSMKLSSRIEPILLHTGQHYDTLMSDTFFTELQIPHPDISLNIGSDTHARQVAQIMEKFDAVCDKVKPDAILVVGDVNSTMACTLVAAKKGIKTIHVEAGIRSRDRTMPEEINRLVTDSVADFLLSPSQDAVDNLLAEGHSPESVELVGNIMIDTLMMQQTGIKSSVILEKFGLLPGEFVTLTMHRPSNVDDPITFKKILDALFVIQTKTRIIFPVHPRTRKMIAETGLDSFITSMKNLTLCDPLGYYDFGKLVSESKFVLTDSGGIQEETTVYGIPCITLRENTERPVTITEGTNELAGSDTQRIIDFSLQILEGKWKKGSIPQLWDGKTAERIVAFIESKF
ncbi:MAG: UDP-N-acetylglucosamine 2-epimerase (non-hydrolyzing) [Bacteroidota bacterium]